MIRYSLPKSESDANPKPVPFNPPAIPFTAIKMILDKQYPADQRYVAHNKTSVMIILVLEGTLTVKSLEGKMQLPEGGAMYIEPHDGYQWLPEDGPVTIVISSVPGWQQTNQRIVHKPKDWPA